jgi:hypothetical protein
MMRALDDGFLCGEIVHFVSLLSNPDAEQKRPGPLGDNKN